MKCCGACVGDRWFSTNVISVLSSETGQCPICQTQEVSLVEANALRDRFESLLGIYQSSTVGVTILELLRKDWCVLDNQNISDDVAAELLGCILGDNERLSKLYVPAPDFDMPHMDTWDSLREELKHMNRFFPKTQFDLERLKNLLELLSASSEKFSDTWFRARIEKGHQAFPLIQMGAPPRRMASSGRANPVGIPYLYLASNETTALAEVRPHPGDSMCIARFGVPSDAIFIDLRNPRKTVSPFLLDDEEQIGMLRRDIGFLEGLARELRAPVLPVDAAIDYIPSQYLCELIKDCGFDGVLYGSSVGRGINLALFDPDRAVASNLAEFSITSVDVVYAVKE